MILLVFEDDQVDRLAPVTTSRPAFAISCGGYHLADLLAELAIDVRYLVRPHLKELQEDDFPDAGNVIIGEGALLVNARLVPTVSILPALRELLKSRQAGVVRAGKSIAAVVLRPEHAEHLIAAEFADIATSIDQFKLSDLDVELPLLDYPHDIVKQHIANFQANLDHRIAVEEYAQYEDGVFVARGATIGAHVVFDTRSGPVVLENDASVGPFSYLQGPLLIGSGAVVVDHASLKRHVAAGPTTKVGGEISCSIIEPYSNKSHHGFLGHSYVGSWANLGAGTTTSNLKNTYGEINVLYDGEKVATGTQFLGCIFGDYAKSAINTSIFTGKTVGMGSVLYGTVTEDVPAFVNYARSLGHISEVSVDATLKTQDRMFARRGLTPRPSDIGLIRDGHRMTAAPRRRLELNSGPPVF